jgi:hypothetical protein
MDIVILKSKLLGCACIFPDGLSQLQKIGGLHRQEKTASWEVFFFPIVNISVGSDTRSNSDRQRMMDSLKVIRFDDFVKRPKPRRAL